MESNESEVLPPGGLLVLARLKVCLWTLQVRRFSEAYFFTEHPKETSLTFQEEL